ncbi:MAG TPA: anthranilate phosphoribosyltransferase [Gammaproteobacteria bacterium]|nr:anthranilate phosphoribosyltransferase [Gammaproteobacteria bacterium]
MDMQSAIKTVTERRDLRENEMVEVMHLLMEGKASEAQIGAFLVGLRMKGETVEEISAAASVMRELVTPVEVDVHHLVDTCGTGGDGTSTFNISTTSAFVVAAAGGHVAKHGNRSISSKSGSADVLEAAGVNLELTPQQVAMCIKKVGVGFMFAPKHHSAMKHVIGPRREMGIRTLFNVLGPLTNPAGAKNQLLGVFDAQWLEPLAKVLERLGSRHVLVVHAEDGLDEITISGPTHLVELKEGTLQHMEITPEQFGIQRAGLESLIVDRPGRSLDMMRQVLDDKAGPARDIVLLNAGAAIYVAGITNSLQQGVDKAREVLARGTARKRLELLVQFSNGL